ncbi:MAG TPA: PAS domain S-box protein [Pseudoduganella sp.]
MEKRLRYLWQSALLAVASGGLAAAYLYLARQYGRTLPLQAFETAALVALLAASVGPVLAYWRQSRARRLLFLEARGRLGAIVETSLDAIISEDLNGVVTSWNPAAAALFGYSREETIGRSLAALIIPPELQHEAAQVRSAVRNSQPLEIPDTRRRSKDGKVVPVSVSVAPIFDERKLVVGASVTVRDITPQKAAARTLAHANEELERQVRSRTEELTKARRQLQGVLDGVPSMIGYWNRDLVNQVANHAYHRWYGVSPEALPGTHMRDLLGEQLYLEIRPYAEAALAGMPQTFGRQMFAADGTLHDVLGHYLPDWIDGQVAGFYAIVHDVSDLANSQRKLHAALRESKNSAAQIERLNGLLEGVLDAATEVSIIATGKDGTIELFNRGAERMFGYRAQELVGVGAPSILCSAQEIAVRAEELSGQLSRAIAGFETFVAVALERGAETRVWTCCRKDGKTFPLSLTVTAMRDGAGGLTGFLCIGFDVSKQREVEESLLMAKNMAEQASRSKSQFVANMSHEIRTPMNAVLGLLQVLQRSKLDAGQLDCVSKAAQAGKTLLGLINDVLDFSKLEAEHLVLDQHHFELDAMLQDVAAAVASACDKPGLEVLVDAPPHLPQALVGDSLRLRQVLVNLMGNAIKFTAQGHVLLRVECLGRHEGYARLRFSVRDTGIGIPHRQREQVFGEFTQAESSTTRRFGGTGLGLAISRRLVDLMGGTLELESQENVGSCFWFDIALLAALPAPGAAAAQGRMIACAASPALRELLGRLLPELGWQADIVADPQEMLARVVQREQAGEPYRVALQGLAPHDQAGTTAAQDWRQLNLAQRPALVLLAAPGSVPAMGGLGQPFTAGQMAQALQAAAQGGTTALAAPAEGRRAARLADLCILLVEDQPLNRMVAERLLAYEGATVLSADGGASGVAIANRHYAELDLILMDLQMPDMDGFSATKAIQSNPATAHIPIIAMTANASVMDRKACLKAGMVDHIGKPIDIEQVVRVLSAHISQSLAQHAAGSRPAAGAVGRLESMDALSQRFGGSLDVYGTALAGFEAAGGELLDKLESHCAQEDAAQAAAELHALKGVAATLGASGYADQCAAMEQALKGGGTIAAVCGPGVRQLLRSELATYAQDLLRRLPEPAAADAGSVAAPLRQWLDEIRSMLEFGSMDALDKLEDLLPQVEHGSRPEIAAAMEAVARLQFEQAAGSLSRLDQVLEAQ